MIEAEHHTKHEEYRRYHGTYNEQMPILIKDGRTPLSIEDIAQKRIEATVEKNVDVMTKWWNKSIYTNDGIAQHPNGNIKIIRKTPLLTNITTQSPIHNGALMLNEDLDESINIYNSLKGTEFTQKELKQYCEHFQTKEETKHNPIWKALIPNKPIRKDYVTATFKLGKKMYAYDKLMGVCIAKPQEICTIRPIFLDVINYDSDAIGNNHLDKNHRGVLVGKLITNQHENRWAFTNPLAEYVSMTRQYK